MKQDSTPLGQALERLESILEQASRQAITFRLANAEPNGQSFFAQLTAREPVIRDAISETCREWIATQNLRPLDDSDAYHFFERLKYGEKLLRWLRSGGVVYQQTANDALCWLLVDSWESVSRPMWLDDLKID